MLGYDVVACKLEKETKVHRDEEVKRPTWAN